MKPRHKKAPKQTLALPDLEQSKVAVINSLTSASGQRTYDHAIREFGPGIVQSLGSRSTAPSSFVIGSTSNSATMPRPRSTFGSPRSGVYVRFGKLSSL